jgi:adenylate cyclase class IV
MKFRLWRGSDPEQRGEYQEVYEEELETRIAVDRSKKDEFNLALKQFKAIRKIPERIVATTRFKLPESSKLGEPYIALPLDVVDDENDAKLKTAISLLGFKITSSEGGLSSYYNITQTAQGNKLKGFLVRIRQQEIAGKRVSTFAVKGPKEIVDGVMKSRLEAEVVVKKPADLVQFLIAVGITEGDYRETKRTTYKSENGNITIELDEFPDSRVPLSVEFEGQSPKEILAEADKFREFGKPSAIGGTKFLKDYISKDEIKDMRFDRAKRKYAGFGRNYSN